jgi:hypothetical protein
MSHTNFTHDINPGNGPAVSLVDSGNGFGTRVFWTAIIPDGDVQVNPGAGTAQLHVRNLPELDYYSPAGNGDIASLGPTWQTGYFDALVNIDVVWAPPVTRRVDVRDAANGFAGQFNENQATVTWSASSTSGFGFTSNPGNFSTSVPEVPGVNGVTAPLNFFAQVGHERNGVFFPAGEPVLAAAAPPQPVPQPLTAPQLQPVVQAAIAAWQAAGASAAQIAALNQVPAHIAPLPAAHLGEEAGGQIWISPNAAGWGWYTDASAASSQAFPVRPGSPAAGKMDLLSVVSHELGHVLGLEDGSDRGDVMGETLAPGVRRLPTADDLPSERLPLSAAAVALALAAHPAVTAPASNGNPAALVPASFAVGPMAVPDAPGQVAAPALLPTQSFRASATGRFDELFAGLAGGTRIDARHGDEGFAW